MITYKRLRQLLSYDDETGGFTWKVPISRKIVVGSAAGSFEKKTGYVRIAIDGIKYKAHRLAWMYTYGYMPENQIDHINRIRNDNRIKNLREVSQQCNTRNSYPSSKNTSGIVGVCWESGRSKWRSTIKVNGKQKNRGYFDSKLEAAKHRLNSEIEYGFDLCNNESTSFQYVKKNDHQYIKHLFHHGTDNE